MEVGELLREIAVALREREGHKELRRDDSLALSLYGEMAKAVRQYIHGDLANRKTAIAEKEIRKVLKTFIAPNLEKIVARKNEIETRSGDHELWAKYRKMYIEYMSLLSYRSFKHFCLLMEDSFDRKIWEPTQHIFDGWFYYANKMALDGTVTFIEKQLPTGYGKSVSDCFFLAWVFGLDINNDAIKVFGNKHNVSRCMETVAELMRSKYYARVFPYYEQFNGSTAMMFDVFRTKDGGELKIHGSKVPVNLLCVGKETTISGTRAKFLFLDDITQAEDKDVMRAHEKDIAKYNDVWFKRSYSMNNFYVIVGGTTYSAFDLLSYLKHNFNFEESKRSKINKFTRVSTSSEIKKDGISVFISVPKLDYETDESTYPLEFPTAKARRQRSEDYRTFMAMEQQRPLPPENTPFYYSNLREYDLLPIVGECGRANNCVAALDPKRRGADNLSMPICFEADDPEVPSEKVYYLLDFLYDERPMKDCIPRICSMIIQHNVTRLYAERNTEECIGKLIEDELSKRGYNSCVIEDVYSVEPKDRRIMNAEGDIKRKIIFPKFGLYPRANEVGRALENVYSYSYRVKNKFDDAIDSLALFAKRFIVRKRFETFGKIITFSR